ncbi:hypothetical protein FAEPRAA2165_01015 [Faecalibacterium duncaniae]|uniref:Uncharacterized protein n=1 Tax=Faecalibacterium duncaniae (strain DSM 17677 / JCM 31915 / A2-165) TaxID=411483 RepID=C7H402_FAED2|nr:hypothetical protein FAEPRAA2165_01015 [Faecalibacterium duncaniae]
MRRIQGVGQNRQERKNSKKSQKTQKIRLTDGKTRDTMISPLLRGY